MNFKRFRSCPVRPLCPLAAPAIGDDGWETIGSSHIVADQQDMQHSRSDDLIDIDDEMTCQPVEPMPQPMFLLLRKLPRTTLPIYLIVHGVLIVLLLGAQTATTVGLSWKTRSRHLYW